MQQCNLFSTYLFRDLPRSTASQNTVSAIQEWQVPHIQMLHKCLLPDVNCSGVLEGLQFFYCRLSFCMVSFKSAYCIQSVCRIRTAVFTAAEVSCVFLVLPQPTATLAFVKPVRLNGTVKLLNKSVNVSCSHCKNRPSRIVI